MFELYDPLGEWNGPAETRLCHRRVIPPFPLKTSLKFITSCLRLHLEVGDLEPLFCTLAVWDVHTKVKLSENFYFHLNSRHAMEMLPESSPSLLDSGFEFEAEGGQAPGVIFIPPLVSEETFLSLPLSHLDAGTQMCRAMFSVTEPNPHIALVLLIDKVVQGTPESSILRAYSSDTLSRNSKEYIAPE